ncbi:MAG: YdcH family protein [Thermodesulfovibrionales bacterium]|nr:YdcH family protein [Thermodesulfovibrionales bacterium]
MTENEIVEVLKQENEEFKKIYNEHRELDARLLEMSKKPYLTSEEEMEKKRMQKEKLYKKDRIAELIREYKKQKNL